MNLERASWIAGIVSAVFTIGWAAWTYTQPSNPISPTPGPILTVNGSQNILIQGNNNHVGEPNLLPPHKTQNPEAEIAKLTTGISKASLQAWFGLPMFDEKIKGFGANNLIFVFPRFFLQAIVSDEGKVIFYSVTTRSEEFTPSIPKLGGSLLTTNFSELGGPDIINGYLGSKYYEYNEKIYLGNLGNLGNYRNFYVGLCPAGVPPSGDKFFPVIPESDGPAAVKKFRESNSPNCYGVGDILGGEEKIVEYIGIGIDYFVARDLL